MASDYAKIYKYPYSAPEVIIDSLRREKLAFFIGAGVSRIIGCKGWEDFASTLLNECSKRKYINHLEYESIKQQKDLKKIITIAHSIFEEKKEEDSFIELFRKSLQPDENFVKIYDIYSMLKRFDAVYVTTNADSHFDSFFHATNCIYKFANNMPIEQGKLYHIHGIESCQESLVFTIDQYLKRYNDDIYRSFLIKLFCEYTVVFIGYGLDEYEVMDFLFEKANARTENEQNRHFFVKAYFSYEGHFIKHEQSYFDYLGVNVLGYEKDELGFEELYRLLEGWERDCHLSTSMIPDGLDYIEKEIIVVKTYEEIDKLVKFINPRESFRKYFFTCLSKNISFSPKFFKYFVNNGYFAPKENISNGYWDMLDCLLIINDYLQQQDDKEIIADLRTVLAGLIGGKPTCHRNYHTDRVLISIMFSFSEDNIEISYIDFLRTALNSNQMVSLVIKEKIFSKCLNFENDKIVKILDIILDSKKTENQYYQYFSLFDRYCLNQFIRDHIEMFFLKIGNVLIDIILEKLEKISDTTFPLIGLDKMSFNYPKNQLDETKYDQMMVVALFCLLYKLEETERNNYINKINNNETSLFKKISRLIENATEAEIPDDNFMYNARTGFDSPYSTEELLAMSTEEICKVLEINLPEYGWDTPSRAGLIETLRAMIARNPNKITDFYDKFLNIPNRYKSAILSGFINNASNKIAMDWANIFEYTDKIIRSPDFKDIGKEEQTTFGYSMPILMATTELIFYYFDRYIVDKTLYDKIKSQLFFILSKNEDIDLSLFSSIGSVVLNTTMGQSYRAIIKLLLFHSEYHNQDTDKWDKEIYDYLFPLLEANSTHCILCYIFGEFLPIFVWLNKDIISDKFHSIMQNKNVEQWDAFISGILYSNYNFDNNIYILLKENGIYDKVLNKENCAEINHLRMIEHACIAYFRKDEDIEREGSLLRKIIINGDKNDIDNIKDFIWRQKEYLKTIDDIDVKKLWGIIVDCLSNKVINHDSEYDNVIAEFLSLLSVIKTIDNGVLHCVEFSINHSTENNLPFFVVNDLTELFALQENKRNVCAIMDMLMTRDILILYKEDEIRKLVEMINQYDPKCASKICNAYLDRGYNFLRDLLEPDNNPL